ncbi:unnamed protein product [Trichobilharzia regenti]|nr:unnamed protein product [Trichobilharzia regenti]
MLTSDWPYSDKSNYRLGTLSHILHRRVSGYRDLSDWPIVPPDPWSRVVVTPTVSKVNNDNDNDNDTSGKNSPRSIKTNYSSNNNNNNTNIFDEHQQKRQRKADRFGNLSLNDFFSESEDDDDDEEEEEEDENKVYGDEEGDENEEEEEESTTAERKVKRKPKDALSNALKEQTSPSPPSALKLKTTTKPLSNDGDNRNSLRGDDVSLSQQLDNDLQNISLKQDLNSWLNAQSSSNDSSDNDDNDNVGGGGGGDVKAGIGDDSGEKKITQLLVSNLVLKT